MYSEVKSSLTLCSFEGRQTPAIELGLDGLFSDYTPSLCATRDLSIAWELLVVPIAAIVTTSYTLHHEHTRISLLRPGYDAFVFHSEIFGFVLNPSPFLLLASCLFLGCSISSFTYRRKETDHLQPFVFSLAVSMAATIGFGLNVNINFIMLGLIPWAMNFAMLFSIIIQWFMNRRIKNESYEYMRAVRKYEIKKRAEC
ncbi:hypothetical protein ACMFMG_003155 [Clarireedia jacksonii]